MLNVKITVMDMQFVQLHVWTEDNFLLQNIQKLLRCLDTPALINVAAEDVILSPCVMTECLVVKLMKTVKLV